MKSSDWVWVGVALLCVVVIVVQDTRSTQSVPALPSYPAAFMQAEFYEKAFGAASAEQADASVREIVVNHHLLAPQLIAQAMQVIATDDPVTVIVASPDHFGRGRAPITSVIADWDTPYGVLRTDAGMTASLSAQGVVDEYAYPFAGEHGIYNITGFILRAMPHARMVPIILKDGAPDAMVDRLAQAIADLPGRVVLVGSFDFTHDSTMAQAERNDIRSIGILKANTVRRVSDIAVDSHAGIRLMMQYAQMAELHFTLLASTNSARVTGNHAQTDVTSYIVGYWSPLTAVVH